MMNKLLELAIDTAKKYNYDYSITECRNDILDFLRVSIETLDTAIICDKSSVNTEVLVSCAYEIVNGLKLYKYSGFIDYLSHMPLITQEARILRLALVKIINGKMISANT